MLAVAWMSTLVIATVPSALRCPQSLTTLHVGGGSRAFAPIGGRSFVVEAGARRTGGLQMQYPSSAQQRDTGEAFTIELAAKPLGLILSQNPSGRGCFVSEVLESGSAALSGQVQVGDFITGLAHDGNALEASSSSLDEVLDAFDAVPVPVVMRIQRGGPEPWTLSVEREAALAERSEKLPILHTGLESAKPEVSTSLSEEARDLSNSVRGDSPQNDAQTEDERAQLRRQHDAVDEAVSALACPITNSLPVDPVTAEDGQVYERAAIEDWLATHATSPLTEEPMGSRLLPNLPVKNMIRSMVTSGALSGEKVEAWRKKLDDEERIARTLREAEAGDGKSMVKVGIWYEFGIEGYEQDYTYAIEWYKKSHASGCASGTGSLGRCYVSGSGLSQCAVRGTSLLTEAALGGSMSACYLLGTSFAQGLYGCPEDEEMARRWYAMVKDATIDDLKEECQEEAAQWLREHPA